MSSTKPKNLGILGAGQLSLLLAEAFSKKSSSLNKIGKLRILAPTTVEPAALLGVDCEVGSTKNLNDLKKFLKTVDVVAIENEFIDCDLLQKALGETEIIPKLQSIRVLQDKIFQKGLLHRSKIPTAEEIVCKDLENPSGWLMEIRTFFKDGFVLKWSRNGYDGKGTLITSAETADAEFDQFFKDAKLNNSLVFAERKVNFVRELAVVATRSLRGALTDFVAYPLTLTRQKKGTCEWAYGPATQFGVSRELENRAKEIAQSIADTLPIEGTFAVEFFEEASGEIFVNEIAPRVHNSAHYSTLACDVSQFESHILAAYHEKLSPPQLLFPFYAMFNVLGPDDVSISEFEMNFEPPLLPNMKWHWYGKRQLRPRRKMGHINFVAETRADLEKQMKIVDEWYVSWKDSFQKSGV